MIRIGKEDKKKLVESIHAFFEEEYEIDLDLLGQDRVYDFFVEELGKTIYNAALDDVRMFAERQREMMESDYYAMYQ